MNARLILLLVLLLAGMASNAQTLTADDHFNKAARLYVKEDKLAALRALDKGLQAFPGDVRMLKLAEELLKEQQQQQQQQQDQKQQQEQQQEQQQQAQKEQRGDEKQERKPVPDQISPEDAERMLDALDRQEQNTQDKVRARMRPTQRRRIEKDW